MLQLQPPPRCADETGSSERTAPDRGWSTRTSTEPPDRPGEIRPAESLAEKDRQTARPRRGRGQNGLGTPGGAMCLNAPALARIARDEGIKPHGLHAWYGALRAAWPSPTEFREGRAPPHLCPEGRGLPSWAIRLAAPVHSRRHRSRAALSRQLGDFQKAAPHTRRVQAVGARRSLQNDARGSAR